MVIPNDINAVLSICDMNVKSWPDINPHKNLFSIILAFISLYKQIMLVCYIYMYINLFVTFICMLTICIFF